MSVVNIEKEILVPVASIAAVLAPLALLACPLGMGLMMVFMGRGMRGRRDEEPARVAPSEHPPSLEQLREEQRRLGAEIERLEGTRTVDRV